MNGAGGRANSIDLSSLQRWFQAVVTHPAGVERGAAEFAAEQSPTIDEVATASAMQTPAERLGVYAHAYWARLLECLREEFPVVRKLVGDEAFDQFAVGYLMEHPSQSYTLAQLGRRLAAYLARTLGRLTDDKSLSDDDAAAHFGGFVVDLATLERSIGEVFDLVGGETLGFLQADQLAAVPAQERGSVRLTPLATFHLSAFGYDVNSYFTASRKLPDAVPDLTPNPTFLALSRREYIVRRTPLSKAQHTLLTAIVAGASLSDALAALLAEQQELPSAGHETLTSATLEAWFADWAAAGFFGPLN